MKRSEFLVAAAVLACAAIAAPARAVSYAVTWWDMSTISINGTVPSGTNFNLPGFGPVRVNYSTMVPPGTQGDTHTRISPANAHPGFVPVGGDAYGWDNIDELAILHHDGSCGTTATYTVTFYFNGKTMPAGELAIGVSGLGRVDTSCNPPQATTVSISGTPAPTFLGDWNLGASNAPTLAVPAGNTLTLSNSVAEPGPGFFNTDLAVVQCNAATSTITLTVSNIADDGIAICLGRIAPCPEITWMDLSSYEIGGTITSDSWVDLPGYGNVQISYTPMVPPGGSGDTYTRIHQAAAQNGNVTSGGTKYSWGNVDHLAILHHDGTCGQTASYSVTFTFSNAVPAGQIAVGVVGLGRIDQTCSPRKTTVSVAGSPTPTFLGDWSLGAGFAPTAASVTGTTLTLSNSVAEPGAGYFNTDFGVVQVNSAASSITLNVSNISDDGIGVTIGRIAPCPPIFASDVEPSFATDNSQLLSVWPNPSSGSTEVRFGLPGAAVAGVEILGVDGRRVRSLGEKELSAGRGSVRWDGRDDRGQRVSSGIYFVRLSVGGRIAAQRLTIIR